MSKENIARNIIQLENFKVDINTLPEEIREEVRRIVTLYNTHTKELPHFPSPERRKELEEIVKMLDFQLRQLVSS